MADSAPPDEIPPFDGFELTAVDPAGPGGDGFWKRIEHGEVVPKQLVRSVMRDLMPAEREEQWARGPGVVGPPRHWDRPSDIDEAVQERNPQFVLRNLHRHEMDAWPHDLWWQVKQVRTTLTEAASDIDEARAAGGRTGPNDPNDPDSAWLEPLSYDQVADLKREHQQLTLHTPWSEFDWRRGPTTPDR